MNKKIIFFKPFLAFVIFFFACYCIGAFPMRDNYKKNIQTQPDEAVFTQKLKSALTYLESACGKDGIKKVVVLREGKTVFKGVASEVTQNIWSCSKSFTGTVLGLLIAEGKCSLDDKVCKYIPGLKEYYPDVTFRNFATMTSGYNAIGDDTAGDHGQSKTPFQP